MSLTQATSNKRVQYIDAVRVSLTGEQSELVEALANSQFDGSKPTAVRYLIELHAGRVVEAANSEKSRDLEVVPFDVARFAKPKLSRELCSYIAGAVAAGLPHETALDMAGVTTHQRREWWRRGNADRADGRESLHADYVTAVLQAMALQKQENINAIKQHRSKVWTAAAWLLERQYPDDFGERKRIDKTTQHNVMPMIDYDRLTLAETRTLLALLKKASPEHGEPGTSRTARPALELVPVEIIEAVEGEWEEVPALTTGAADVSSDNSDVDVDNTHAGVGLDNAEAPAASASEAPVASDPDPGRSPTG